MTDSSEDLDFLTSMGTSFSDVLGPVVPEISGQDVYEVMSEVMEGPVTAEAVYALTSLDRAAVLAQAFNNQLGSDAVNETLVLTALRLTRTRWDNDV